MEMESFTVRKYVALIEQEIKDDANMKYYVKAFAKTSDLEDAVWGLGNDISTFARNLQRNGVTFDETPKEFVINSLKKGDFKPKDAFKSRDFAEECGFKWFDEHESYLQVDEFDRVTDEQNILNLDFGDIVTLGDVWDGKEEAPSESYSYWLYNERGTDTWVNYEFEFTDPNAEQLINEFNSDADCPHDILSLEVRITNIELL